jgi:type IV pilus assembly protein PilC
MPDFHFKAMDAGGKIVLGASSAADSESLADILRGQGLFLMECSATNVGAQSAAAGAPAPSARRFGLPAPTPSLEDVSFFTTQMSVMLSTGLPLLEALELLTQQARTRAFRDVVHEISGDVSRGQPLSAAFKRHPKAFSPIYVSMLSAGEANGRLDTMLSRLADYLDFRLAMRRKIRAALLYPLIVTVTAAAVVVFMLVFVIPTFIEVFKELGVVLPLPTRILIRVSELVRAYWYAGPLSLLGLWGAHRWMLRTSPRYEYRLARVVMATPIIGVLVRNMALTRILRTLASLLEGGVTILRALDLTKDAAGNAVFRELLEKTAVEVRDGKTVSAAFAASPVVPKLVISMLATGERTGALPAVINRVSLYYESETDVAIKNLFAALEPIFIVILGVMVGGIAITVLLPMFDLARGIT